MSTITLTIPAGTLEPVARVMRANVPSLRPESDGATLAYNDTLPEALQAEADTFAAEYSHACTADEPCARILSSGKHAGKHIRRVARRGGVWHANEQDGHTPFSTDEQARKLANLWADRVARAESAALSVYITVKKYSGK